MLVLTGAAEGVSRRPVCTLQYLGPYELLVAAKIALDRGLTLDQVAQAIDDAELRVRAKVSNARLIDLKGKRFGMLEVLERKGTDPSGRPLWLCKCDCGRKATMNLRVDAEGHAVAAGAQTEIGGNDRYVALCRRHGSDAG